MKRFLLPSLLYAMRCAVGTVAWLSKLWLHWYMYVNRVCASTLLGPVLRIIFIIIGRVVVILCRSDLAAQLSLVGEE